MRVTPQRGGALLLGLWLALGGMDARAESPVPPPRLVVMLIVDQLRADTLSRIERRLGPRGLKRLLTRGTRYMKARYRQAGTFTAPGHAVLASGAYPYRSGIVANKTWDWRTGTVAPALADPDHPVLGPAPAGGGDTSPANLRVATVGDALKAQSPLSKVVAVSLKARVSVILGGHAGQAFWFSEESGRMTTSSYYQRELPRWVKDFNARGIPELSFGRRWQRSQPPRSYEGPDDVPSEADVHGLGRTFPHPVTGGLTAPGPEFYSAFITTPFATDYELAFVKAAVEAEQLGADDVPDLLAVGLSATDIAGHAYGPESQEVQDHLFAVDRAVADLLAFLDNRVRKGRFVVVLTADHGSAAIPEKRPGRLPRGRRIREAELVAAVNAAASAELGPGEWVSALESPSLFLNIGLAAQRNVAPEVLERLALKGVLGVPNVATAFTRTELVDNRDPDRTFFRAAQLSFHPDVSGDLLVIPWENSFWGKWGEKPDGTGHGTPYPYDAQVPLALYGVGIPRRVHWNRVDMADVAPTVASLLGLGELPDADGRPLPR